ncbi:ligase-associated DNA damage response endonuclease PdeM [Novosphingobium sp. KACC 22771]|uniref:ligase-associated DNA damage response endonuclease PdeM n=1 Tax=Novosphingobium sp. KACC 22771 TaxID=3025670 RepID=UPI003FD50224
MDAMQFAPFSFAGHEWLISNSRAVYWPAQQALLVADLHLEKASWYAQSGQMLPPYDSRETLERLGAAAAMTGARRVLCLGDNFHDDDGPARMEPEAARMLGDLARRLDVVWIVGNHDAGLAHRIAGDVVEELMLDGITLRHEAETGETGPEISGHYHPKLRVRMRGRMISRPCALRSENRLILPAFGALTGGMDAADPALIAALQPAKRAEAILCAAAKTAILPVWTA